MTRLKVKFVKLHLHILIKKQVAFIELKKKRTAFNHSIVIEMESIRCNICPEKIIIFCKYNCHNNKI